MDRLYVVVSIVLSGLVLLGIKMMSSPRTAVNGNRLSALAMFTAILLTLWNNGILTVPLLWAAMAVGAAFGLTLGLRVKMIQMPQMVALLNGFGGAASALVSMMEVMDKYHQMATFNKLSGQLGLIVGGVTFSGSMIAAAKLDRRMTQMPVHLPNHNFWANLSIVAMFGLGIATLFFDTAVVPLSVLVLILSNIYGVLFAIRVGGADMPITISLLNSFSGLAGSIVGFTISDPLLIAVGAIVGASGLILTQIMCRAMNRSLAHVLSGAIAKPSSKPKTQDEAPEAPAEPAAPVPAAEALQAPEEQAEDPFPAGRMLREAKRVIIVPGYGMAIAQAQQHVKRLMDALEAKGTEVKFAIHPVAGRMPGHMNVLLAEVDVPYDKLCEMDDINPEFPETDVVIVVGACDVVNPAANTAEDTPIYGMPVLDVDKAKNVIVCNLDTKPGYSGVDNPLYEMPHVVLLLGDAKESLTKLLQAIEGQAAQQEAPAMTQEADTPEQPQPDSKQALGKALATAKKVIIVPGYGMAIAQAQQHVKRLMDALEAKGTEVKFAIHPVAGRMPGHMNVLLAEVDVPYDKLCEMDDINPEFPETDVVIVVGACDVVNPAANTAEDTPIYGMPVLDVDKAKNVIVCNLDTKPGYSGVDNPLYEMPHVVLLLGDAKESLSKLLEAVEGYASEGTLPKADAEEDVATTQPQPESKESLGEALAKAKKVIIVPGYGMAIAQAQQHVKRLMDALEARGVEVKFAIHPVAGRMPGHMNVLLAEVDVPYDKLCEMDDINPEFPETDVAIVVGACDVVNPAANTAEDTPIYGMPILDVDKAKKVIVCNLDTKPGYSGVDNPLYEMPHVVLLLGDAKESLQKLLAEVEGQG
ncbi:MAG TPA: NAD(P)(+) transhydrogenase (Re/Si-specific) subunit beta [Bacillota bacterium]|nr:NAD(P)(+) transhydrogenase (Re/Si-specific) subunit beta [Bacillota bacterium]